MITEKRETPTRDCPCVDNNPLKNEKGLQRNVSLTLSHPTASINHYRLLFRAP